MNRFTLQQQPSLWRGISLNNNCNRREEEEESFPQNCYSLTCQLSGDLFQVKSSTPLVLSLWSCSIQWYSVKGMHIRQIGPLFPSVFLSILHQPLQFKTMQQPLKALEITCVWVVRFFSENNVNIFCNQQTYDDYILESMMCLFLINNLQ